MIIIALFFTLAVSQSFSDEGDNEVHLANNLQQVSQQAKEEKLPVLLFFASTECEFCEMLEEDHLASMAHAPSYKDKVIIRKVNIDDYDYLQDFSGSKISADEFSDRFSIRVTPTLVFLDHKGNQLGKKMLGYNRSDFFSIYLDEAIDKAKTLIQ